MAHPAPPTRDAPRRPSGPFAAGDPRELERLLLLVAGSDSVELKLTVPEGDRRSVLQALGVDPLTAVIRQSAFIDTPDLRLQRAGLILRVRRTQHRPPDITVKLRPVDPESLPTDVRSLRGLVVEVDASPAGFVCSCSVKREISDTDGKEILGGRADISGLLGRSQRRLLEHAGAEQLPVEDLTVLGPIHVLRSKFVPEDFPRRMVAELWFLPDGSRILELSTRCEPAAAFMVAAEARVLLARHGVDLSAPQDMKTSAALTILVAQLTGGAAIPDAQQAGDET